MNIINGYHWLKYNNETFKIGDPYITPGYGKVISVDEFVKRANDVISTAESSLSYNIRFYIGALDFLIKRNCILPEQCNDFNTKLAALKTEERRKREEEKDFLKKSGKLTRAKLAKQISTSYGGQFSRKVVYHVIDLFAEEVAGSKDVALYPSLVELESNPKFWESVNNHLPVLSIIKKFLNEPDFKDRIEAGFLAEQF